MIDPTWKYQINGAFGSDGVFEFEEVMLSKVFENGISDDARSVQDALAARGTRSAVPASWRSSVRSSTNSSRRTVRSACSSPGRTTTGRWPASYNNGQRTLLSADERYTNFTDNPTKWAFSARAEYKLSGDWSDFKGFSGGIDQDQDAVMLGVAFMGQQYNAQVQDGSIPGAPNSTVEFDNSTVWGDHRRHLREVREHLPVRRRCVPVVRHQGRGGGAGFRSVGSTCPGGSSLQGRLVHQPTTGNSSLATSTETSRSRILPWQGRHLIPVAVSLRFSPLVRTGSSTARSSSPPTGG